MFDSPSPRVFNIPSGKGFAARFAEGVVARVGADADPMALARVTIYAPTRRAVRTLTEAFVDLAGGRPILAPRLLTLADLDDPMGLGADLHPAISGTERLLTLTRLIRALGRQSPHLAQEATATALARDLMGLIDQIHGERLDLDALDGAAPEDHAAHWSETVRFLDILRTVWPDYLAERDVIDPVERRATLIERQIEAWRRNPPTDPVIVAGSTGSVGISADLISAAAHLPQGAVVLPGLDRTLDAASFRALPLDHPDHPQAGLARLLARIGGAEGPVPRADVPNWTGAEDSPRQRLISIAMRPAPVTANWLAQRSDVVALAPEALAAVDLIEAETQQEEAQAIAFAIREAIAEPEKTVALVTTDGMLGRRVSAALRRWNIVADDSAGRPLPMTPPGIFLSLLLEEGLRGGGPGDPARWLALVKHPLAFLGLPRADHLSHLRYIETRALRREGSGCAPDAIRKALTPDPDDKRYAEITDRNEAAFAWLDTLEDALAPLRMLIAREEVPLSEIVTALRASANLLSLRPDEEGTVEVWEEETGAAAQAFLDDIAEHAHTFGALAPADAPALMMGLMADRKVRAPYGQHPRVSIWGTLEARMLCADVMILGGLNEDSWPKLPDPDPWMSRAMRRDFGLPPLERRIGLSSHDFQQAFCADRVILTRARKQEGTPTVASRWLQRLTTLLGAEGDTGFAPDVLAAMRARGNRYRGYAGHLARLVEGKPVGRPAPTPAVEHRPRQFSVTEVETLARDPYAIYARKVLGLREMPGLSPDPDARDRGNVIHRVVERVVEETMDAWLDEDAARALFEREMEAALGEVAPWPAIQAFYRARIKRIAPWFLAEEADRRSRGEHPAALEVKGALPVDVPGFARVDLTGYADRIDRLPGEAYAVYDYKTGEPPSEAQVAAFAQQLPLEGAMLRDGAFEGLAPGTVSKLAHIRLQGGDKGGEEKPLAEQEALIAEALPKLRELLTAYAEESRGYLSRARPMSIMYEGAFDHLARVGEWVGSEGGEE